MFAGESQRKQGRLSTLQFESEIKFTAIFSIIRHDKDIFLSAGYFFPRKQSALYFFSEITETSLKSSMVGHLEGYF